MAKNDIDWLAMKYVNRHPNDKSDYYLARMNRLYGRKTANAALKRAEKVSELMGIKIPVVRKNVKVVGRGHNQIRGRNVTLNIIDDVCPYVT